jgi:hypothetical protein
MNTYRVLKVKGVPGDISGRRFSPVYGEYAFIDDYPWGGYYAPDARANVEWDNGGLWVTMCAKEETISAHETQFGGAVCRDSCLEFFVNPCPDIQDKYINIEVNPRGTMHIGVGAGRHDRRVLEAMPEDMRLSVSGHHDSWWAVRYYLSNRLMRELLGEESGKVMAGNFYTCDETVHPHFGTWNPVNAPMPDFHRPEYFGRLEII